MAKLSAGIIAYRHIRNSEFEVLLVHPGGPLWKNKDDGAWSIPKGEYVEGEDGLSAAKREFEEETGNVLPDNQFIPLQPVRIKSGKVITAWAVAANFEECFVGSNFFEMEWPPRSGKKQTFAEVDKAEWFTLEKARLKINAGQVPFLERLAAILK